MFEISFPELLVICLVALLVIKPEDLPEIMRMAGRTIRKIRKMINELSSSFKDMEEIDAIKDTANDIKKIKGDSGELYEAFDISDLGEIDNSRKKTGNQKDLIPPHP